GMNAAREHVRVARSLRDLPLIRAQFESGRFSYSHVRALTRVATPDNEEELVEMARCAPTAQLEKMVRAFRGAVRAAETDEAKRRLATRHLTYFYDDDGSFVINARLSPEDGAVVEKALQILEGKLEEEGFSAETLEETVADDALGQLIDQAFSRPELDQRDASAVTAADDARRRLYLAQATSPVERRRADALVALAEAALASHHEFRHDPDRFQVVAHVDLDVLADVADEGRSELADGPVIAPETMRRLGCDSSIVTMVERDGEVLSVGRKTRAIPIPIKRALRARDGHCTFPGCTNSAWVEGHHIEHWARGGETKLSNLCLLCRAHHRAVHEYGYEVTIHDGEPVFFRPDGSRIEPPTVTGSDPDLIVRENNDLGLSIDAETSVPDWYGETMDYDVAVSWLMQGHGFTDRALGGN
ncbi:MAG TPA: DUF222 domain-containing protein, partial [Actinomycetota bacterium]|nr:DUF222 domain-containing protein [Actinomycetota bacterium]